MKNEDKNEKENKDLPDSSAEEAKKKNLKRAEKRPKEAIKGSK